MSSPRTLPIRLAPLPGEALDSWLEALAERLHTNVFDLFRFAGVTTRWNTAKSRKPWVHHLDADQLTAVSTATGVPADTLAAMTLDRYAGTGLIIDRPARAGSRPRWWRGLRGSRFCPNCLAGNGNRWMLSWQLAWSFACTRHHTLLLDACPACGRRHQQISKLMASSGIGPPALREVLRALDSAWLREQYEDNHRSFADIAADLGIPPSDLARHARQAGLAIRHGVAAHKHILANHGGPAAFSTTIWAAFATRGAEQRVTRFLAIPGHPDLNRAAKHLGVRKAVLTQQLDQLEHAVGATLLETQPDARGIKLTHAGEKFAQDATPVLAILDRAGNGDSTANTRVGPI